MRSSGPAAVVPDRAPTPPGPATFEVQAAVRRLGEHLLTLIDAADPPSLFTKRGFYGAMMERAMRDERFKTQLFRFVDVLPALKSSGEVASHLEEYFGKAQTELPAALRLGLKAAGAMDWLLGAGVKSQVAAMARQFMLGNDEKEIAATLRRRHAEGVAFTVDLLGEAVVSEREAGQYAERCLALLEMLARETARWPGVCPSNLSPRGPVPALNLSVKLSALYSQIHPADPETAAAAIGERLRPILRRARDLGAFVNLDMESYTLKDLTLRLFKTMFAEPEFAAGPACGLAMQAYLRDCEADLRGLIQWAREHRRRVTVRLVKGAYWDCETVLSRQRNWPAPVFARKAESDANFEDLSALLLENDDAVDAAFGTHNARSIAYALAQAERRGIAPRNFEFQMLYGMAEPVKAAVLRLNCRLREYCPVGDWLPGIAYLVRRLLENSSNEGFLARRFARSAGPEELLEDPRLRVAAGDHPSPVPAAGAPPPAARFRNEPPTDFTRPAARAQFRAALGALRRNLGRRCPLVIGRELVPTSRWLPSLNPANQQEVIGWAAQATVAEAEAALAAAVSAQRSWARTPAPVRAAVLEATARLMRRDRAALCALEILEAGKNWTEADADVAEAIDFCNYYAAVMRRLGPPRHTQWVAGESNEQVWRPRGVGVIIAPWNFPLAILAGMTAAAVVAGNAVILKPSQETPIIAARFMGLLLEAGLPAGVANLVMGPGRDVGAHLAAHPQVDFVAFTGSKEVGLKLLESAGRVGPGQANLKKIVCEMGGKNCIIVDSDADLDEAVAGCIASAFGYQGQKCSALSRLAVLAGNYDRFLERLIAAADSLRVGPAEEPGATLGPVINRQAQQRLLEVIAAGKQDARLAWQGTVPDDPNACYVPPALFTDVPRASRLFREEIFGPVLAVVKVKDFEDALALANDSEFALTGGCYSRSPANLERAKAEMLCGNLYLNRPITGAIVERQPFGGFRMSGGGTKAGGPEYLENFLVPQVITENCLRRGFAPSEAREAR